MGSCISRGSAASVVETPTRVKVITLSGVLREYPSHVTTANVLAGEGGASCFLCSSDELFYNYPIPPLALQRPLLPGPLYIVLPAERLRRPLSMNDVRDLLGKAMKELQPVKESGRKGKKGRPVAPERPRVISGGHGSAGADHGSEYPEVQAIKFQLGQQSAAPVVSTCYGTLRRGGYARCRAGYRRRCSFRARLSTILEEEES